MITVERINDIFTKYHLNASGEEPWPFRPVLHRFTAPDLGLPHDHPWLFTSHVLLGSYVEEVYTPLEDGVVKVERIQRRAGTSHSVPATHIHRLVELPDGECWTLVIYGPRERDVLFWDFSGQEPRVSRWP